jgi:hypothetical protein
MVSVHPASRAELLHVLMLPDFDRADRIGEFYRNPQTRTFAELLIVSSPEKGQEQGLPGSISPRPGGFSNLLG